MEKILGLEIVQLVGIVAGILTAISVLPQLIKIWKDKKAENISLLMISLLMAGLAVWVLYGVMKNDIPLIVTNAFSFTVNVLILILSIKYGDKK